MTMGNRELELQECANSNCPLSSNCKRFIVEEKDRMWKGSFFYFVNMGCEQYLPKKKNKNSPK